MKNISLQTPVYLTAFPLYPSGYFSLVRDFHRSEASPLSALFPTSKENIGVSRIIVKSDNTIARPLMQALKKADFIIRSSVESGTIQRCAAPVSLRLRNARGYRV